MYIHPVMHRYAMWLARIAFPPGKHHWSYNCACCPNYWTFTQTFKLKLMTLAWGCKSLALALGEEVILSSSRLLSALG